MKMMTKLGTICALVGALGGCGETDEPYYSRKDGEILMRRLEPGCRTYLTRTSRITRCDLAEGIVVEKIQPHDPWNVREESRKDYTYFPDGAIRMVDFGSAEIWDYAPDGGILLTTHTGEKYRCERAE